MTDGVPPDLESVAVVMLGSFNPGIYHPAWLASQGLMSDTEASTAEINLVTQDIANFTGEWLNLECTSERLAIGTHLSAYYPALRDLAVGLLRLLPHTPIKSLGVNRIAHFRLASEEQWHEIGHQLVPKDFWEGLLRMPGTRKLTVQGERPDSHAGMILMTFEPSVRIHPGIYADVNDHYERPSGGDHAGSAWAIEIFEKSWEESMTRATDYFKAVMSLASGGR